MTLPLRSLYNFQRSVVAFGAKRDRCAYFLDPGLGKTICSLRTIDTEKKTLVVCPASLRKNWWAEIKEENLNEDLFDVISYERLLQIFDELLVLGAKKDPERKAKILKNYFKRYRNLVVDESHYIKNVMAKRSQAILDIQRYIKNIIFLTGTPTPSSCQDLFLTLSICEPGKWGTYVDFCKKYAEPVYDPYKRITKFTGYKNMSDLHMRMKSCSIRFKKEHVLDDLPDRVNNRFIVPNRSKFAPLSDFDLDMLSDKTPHISEIRIEAAEKKMRTYLDALNARNIKRGLIFVWHQDIGSQLVDKLPGNSALINGNVGIEKRYDLISKYQAGEIDWLVLGIAAAGVGLNITNTDFVSFFEMPWTGAEIEQALSRAIRIGNHHESVNVEYVILEDSIDEAIYQIAMARKHQSGFLIDGGKHFLK